MPFLLPLATGLTAIITVNTLSKTTKVIKRRNKRKQKIGNR